MANQATYDDANLCLKLFELRREETMRKARQWFGGFSPGNPEHMQQISVPGSPENTYFRMVTSYWDMAAAFVTSGVLNEELFLDTNGEVIFVWEKMKTLLPDIRTRNKNPNYLRNLETVGNAGIKRMNPEAYQHFSGMVKGLAAAGR